MKNHQQYIALLFTTTTSGCAVPIIAIDVVQEMLTEAQEGKETTMDETDSLNFLAKYH